MGRGVREVAEHGDDELVDTSTPTDWDEDEWRWI